MIKEEALKLIRAYSPIRNEKVEEALLTLIPELKESEDERIRKEIISYIEKCILFDSIDEEIPTLCTYIAWLKKQGEQKPTIPTWKYKKDHTPLLRDSIILNKYGCVAKSPSGAIVSDVWVLDYDELAKLPKEEIEKQNEQETLCGRCRKEHPSHSCQDITALNRCAVEHEQTINKVEPKFKVGDWIVHNESECVWQITKIIKSKDGIAYDHTNGYFHSCFEDNYHLWTIQDVKDGDIIVCNEKHSQAIGIVKNYVGKLGGCDTCFKVYCYVNWNGYFLSNGYIGSREIYPATEEQCDLLFSKMEEAGYKWDNKNKELIKI